MTPQQLKRLAACACQQISEQYRQSLQPDGISRMSHCQAEWEAWQTLEAAAAAAKEVWEQCEGTS